jgi:lipoprotein-anchoring transpeptidase ErfK/SrfK
VRPARFAIAAVTAALAAGLVQAPALAESAVPATPSSTVVLDVDTAVPTEPPVDPDVPAPTGLTVDTGTNSATITFTAPVTAKAITNYQWSDSGGVWVDFAPAVTSSPVTIPDITAGQPYEVALRAVTADGVGAASEIIKFQIAPPPPPPTRPVIFEVDGKPLGKSTGAKVITLKPGVSLKMRNVPEGSTIAIVDPRDPNFKLDVRETTKARMWVTDTLPPARRLFVTITGSAGNVVAKTNFKMTRAEKSFTVDVWPKTNNMGAGVPLIVEFGIPITNRAEVERALVVTADKEIGEAGWYWVSSTKAVFRPRNYWPGHTTVTLDANLTTIQGAKDAWGPKVQSTFKTGDQVILKVNLNTYRMKYTRNGVEERTFKISGGKAGWLTEAGTKVLTAHISPKRLYNPDPKNPWDVTVKYGIRVNDNGEYIHDAPWNKSIGYANTSHGCTNMTEWDMAWIWRNTKFGDVAEYTGSSDKIGTDDYLAGYWNFTWPEWKRGSALWQDS